MSEDSPGEGHGNPLQYSCLVNSMDRGAWRATVHRVRKFHSWALILYWISDSRTDIPNHHRKLFPKTLRKDRVQKQKTKQKTPVTFESWREFDILMNLYEWLKEDVFHCSEHVRYFLATDKTRKAVVNTSLPGTVTGKFLNAFRVTWWLYDLVQLFPNVGS